MCVCMCVSERAVMNAALMCAKKNAVKKTVLLQMQLVYSVLVFIVCALERRNDQCHVKVINEVCMWVGVYACVSRVNPVCHSN